MIARKLICVSVILLGFLVATDAQAEVTGSTSSEAYVNFNPNQTDFQPGDQISVSAEASASVPVTDPAAEILWDIEIQGTGSSFHTSKIIQPGNTGTFDAVAIFYNVPTEGYSTSYTAFIRLWYVDESMGAVDIDVDYQSFNTD